MLSVFLSACRTALYLYPCFTFPWSSLCLSLTSIPTTPSLIPNVLIYLSIPSLPDKVTALPFPQGECRIQFCFPVNTCSSFPSVQNISPPPPLFRSTLQLSPFALCPGSWSVGMASVGACPVGNFRREGMPSSLPGHWSWHVPHCSY